MSRLALLVLAIAMAIALPFPGAAAEILVFAAASTAPPIEELAARFTARSDIKVKLSFAGSGTLARQIALGAPADLFLSANPQWMDHLAERQSIEPESRRDLLSNRLLLVAAKASSRPLDPWALAADPASGRIAIGDPAHVPVGAYTRAALSHLGLWEKLEPRLVPMPDARAARAMFERGAVGAAILYASDAPAAPLIGAAWTFPAESHPPIVYPIALIAGRAGAEARALLAFLEGPEAAEVFLRHGFLVTDGNDGWRDR